MDFSFLQGYLPYFNVGATITVFISILVVFFGTILGILIAMVQRSKWRPLAWLANLYVWIFRGTPMIVQIALANVLLTIHAPRIELGGILIDLGRVLVGIIVISMNSGAYVSETVRAGINAVPKGQIEAAHSLGIRPGKTMRYVVLPQAIKNILPALGNEFITIVKDSSLLATIGVMELWNGAQTVQGSTYIPLTPYLYAAFYYLILTTVLTALIKGLENLYNKGEKDA